MEQKSYTYRFRKIHFLPITVSLFVILLSLPLLLVVARSQTNTQSHAQAGIASIDSAPFYEDNTPADPDVKDDPSGRVALAKEVDSLPNIKATTTKPNVVFIMLDDINPIDGSLWKSNITPNIYNAVIANGIKFNNYYGETSLCCPGRVGFFTGQHTQNHGVGDLDGTKFNPSETFPVELKKSGYFNVFAGKYVNYYSNIPAAKAVPPGWNMYNAIYENNGRYYNYRIINRKGIITKHGSAATDYSTDVIANTAVAYLKQVPANQPVFAYIAPFASHGPRTPAPRHKTDPRCNNLYWNPPSYNETDVSDKPAYIQGLALLSGTKGYEISSICRPILSVDDLVGRVTSTLKAQGRYDNTIFILAADNGMAWGAHRLTDKTVPYATQLPLYISWPAGRGTAPSLEDTTLQNIDFAPTFCELAGCNLSNYPNGQTKPDGLSFFNLLKNIPVSWTRDAVLESQPTVTQNGKPLNAKPETRPAWWAVRTTNQSTLGLWHYVEYDTGERELYDLSHGPCYTWVAGNSGDPCELNNLLGPNQSPSPQTLALADQLHTRLIQLKAEKGGPASVTNTPTPTPIPTVTLSPTPTIQSFKR